MPLYNGQWSVQLHEVSNKLKYCKKPKSVVDGDIIPQLVTKCHDLLAIPLQHIYNLVLQKFTWPDKWKSETVKIIPKCAVPESIKDVRNISCTPLFSKVLEHFVLDKLRQYCPLAGEQFGGVKGVGIDHFLCETWHEVLMNLENDGAASSLVSIDFSKAFNRMDHAACLEALRDKGVPENVVSVVQAFLYNRKMAVHINGKISEERNAPGGAPQGSVLGSFLFCNTTERLLRTNINGTSMDFAENGEENSVSDSSWGSKNEDGRLSPIAPPLGVIPPWAEIEANNTSDDEDSIDLGVRRPNQRLLDTTVESVRASQSLIEELTGAEPWSRTSPSVRAYIDDFNVVERVRTSTALCHISASKTEYKAHAPGTEKLIGKVKKTAEEIGMVVNEKKTQLLCIHPSGKAMKTYIRDEDGENMESGDSLKILGFTFGSSPDVSANTAVLVRKFVSSLWALRKMKKARMNQEDMLFSYKSVIRPLVDFASPSYHSLLTGVQAMTIERQQLRAMKIIFGDTVSYRTVVESGKIQLLYDRREELLKKLAIKAEKQDRCKDWFPLNRNIEHDLRRREKYFIPKLKTERAKKSPIIRMRQLLNEMHAVP